MSESVAARMRDELTAAEEAGELTLGDGPEIGPAMEHLGMDIAGRADRCHVGEVVPITDTDAVDIEAEESDVALHFTHWLRAQLPGAGEGGRRELYQRTMELLRGQLEDEAHHLRRLHMGVIGASLMGVEVDDSQGLPRDEEVEQKANFKEIVDAAIVMVANRRLRGRTIRDMLAWGGAGRASSSTDPSWPREVELLRRWLNEYMESGPPG